MIVEKKCFSIKKKDSKGWHYFNMNALIESDGSEVEYDCCYVWLGCGFNFNTFRVDQYFETYEEAKTVYDNLRKKYKETGIFIFELNVTAEWNQLK